MTDDLCARLRADANWTNAMLTDDGMESLRKDLREAAARIAEQDALLKSYAKSLLLTEEACRNEARRAIAAEARCVEVMAERDASYKRCATIGDAIAAIDAIDAARKG